jgi:hypothetical protein
VTVVPGPLDPSRLLLIEGHGQRVPSGEMAHLIFRGHDAYGNVCRVEPLLARRHVSVRLSRPEGVSDSLARAYGKNHLAASPSRPPAKRRSGSGSGNIAQKVAASHPLAAKSKSRSSTSLSSEKPLHPTDALMETARREQQRIADETKSDFQVGSTTLSHYMIIIIMMMMMMKA